MHMACWRSDSTKYAGHLFKGEDVFMKSRREAKTSTGFFEQSTSVKGLSPIALGGRKPSIAYNLSRESEHLLSWKYLMVSLNTIWLVPWSE
jgi:hypothetical protein